MNADTKQNIRAKVSTYLKRVGEIKNISQREPSRKQPVIDGRSRANEGNDADQGDSEKRRMMQKFEG
jgi:hypothetical protein